MNTLFRKFPRKFPTFIKLLPFFFVAPLLLPLYVNGAAKDEFVNPTVIQPFVDGVSLRVPEELAGNRMAEMGFVDVTTAPFAADPSGIRDSTIAIQKAVDFARDKQMVCYFPSGKYIVSGTIACIQNRYRRLNGVLLNGRDFPCVLVGSRIGKRPEIILLRNSPGFQDPDARKYIFHFWARGVKDASTDQPNISMNQMLVNLDITIGEGNTGAVAIRHQAAQGSAIQESTIDATHGLAGIEGGIGSGGGISGVTIIGGRIGMDIRESQPAPTIAGITLLDQTQTALVYEGRQTLTAVGIKITSRTNGPVVRTGDGGKAPFRGQINFIDSQITFAPDGERTAIAAGSSVYLENVSVENAARVVAFEDGTVLTGNKEGWLTVQEYARGVNPRKWKGYNYTMSVLSGGTREFVVDLVQKNQPPAANQQQQHLISAGNYTWEDESIVNVKNPPYLAKGDGSGDDHAAIQRAIDERGAVFLPKGYYRVSRPLRLGENTRLIGVARHLSIITPDRNAGVFSNSTAPAPLVETVDNPDTNTVLAFLTLYVPKTVIGAYALDWRSGGGSVVRDVNFTSVPPPGGFGAPGGTVEKNSPLIRIVSSGGGAWWNFFQEEHFGQGRDYRHLLISDTTQPLRIYQCNPEHAMSDANFEIRRAKGVRIFGLKGEGNKPVLRILQSEDVVVYGYGGNAAAQEGNALFEIIDSSAVTLVNLVDSPRLSGEGRPDFYAGVGVDPAKWHMVLEKKAGSENVYTLPFERPVLYKIPRVMLPRSSMPSRGGVLYRID